MNTREESTILSQNRDAPDNGTKYQSPDDDDAIGSKDSIALKNHNWPVCQRVEGEAS